MPQPEQQGLRRALVTADGGVNLAAEDVRRDSYRLVECSARHRRRHRTASDQ